MMFVCVCERSLCLCVSASLRLCVFVDVDVCVCVCRLTGGTVMDRIVETDHFSERQAAKVY